MSAEGRKEAIKLDKQGGMLLRKANALLQRGRTEAACGLLRQVLAVYERIPALDPEAGPGAEMIAAFTRVGLAECLTDLASPSDQEEAKNLAKAAVPVLEQTRRRGVGKCQEYLERARRIVKDGPIGKPAALQVETARHTKGLSPRLWGAIITGIAAIVAAVIRALLGRS